MPSNDPFSPIHLPATDRVRGVRVLAVLAWDRTLLTPFGVPLGALRGWYGFCMNHCRRVR
jgi:hypothetical protein